MAGEVEGSDRLIGAACSPGLAVGHVTRPEGHPGDGPRVVVAAELAPADVASLDAASVAAVAMAGGGPLSHAAIMVRSLGIPAVTGLGPALLAVPAGTLVLVDGDTGTVCVRPTPEEVGAARLRQRVTDRAHQDARRLAANPAVSRDGGVVEVFANVGGLEDARRAVLEGADGIGMLRTEFLFLNQPDPPDEQVQYDAYRAIADALGERPLVIRTLDLGADLPAWDAPPEPNPALGHRGIRLTLARPDLLDPQLRAVVRLAQERHVGVMFPMVSTIEELHLARARLAEVTPAASSASALALDVGITVEVPAAALTAGAFARHVDFLAIGTNDLTQYTLATDRANAAVAALADGLHPAVLRLVREVTEVGERHGRTVCVVGELATDPIALPVLLGLGVTRLSVRPNAVATVKAVVRSVTIREARALANAALGAESAAAVRALVAGSR